MLMQTRTELEPLERLRTILPSGCLSTFELLIGAVHTPPDQPQCATAIVTLANSFLAYAEGIRHVRPQFNALIRDVQDIASTAAKHALDIQGIAPAGQLSGRISQNPDWTLLIELSDEHIPLRVALGAELTISMLTKGKINSRYCIQLRRDANKYGRPQGGEERRVEDLEELQFGRGWLGHFKKVDRQVRRRIELPDPDGPIRPEGAEPKHVFDC